MSHEAAWWFQDQNGALEMELNDLKSQLDQDVLQTRQLEETLGDQRRMEVNRTGRP